MMETRTTARGHLIQPGTHRSMSTWSQIVKSYEAIPVSFRSTCRPLLANIQPFPYVVFAPVISGFRRKAAEQLICEVDDTFYLWERMGSQVTAAAYPLQHISMMEVGHILLYSWITISGVTREGLAAASTIPFNTVSTPYFETFVNRVRPAADDADEVAWQAEKDKFNHLETDSYKFMNYARKSLAPGEKVIQTVWQPKIRKPVLTLFGRSFYRTLSLAHLAVLTDKEVIFIGDDPRLMEVKGGHYGGIWQYIPLRHIVSVSLTERADDLWTLSLNLTSGSHRLDKLFAAANQREIRQFRDKLAHLMEAA